MAENNKKNIEKKKSSGRESGLRLLILVAAAAMIMLGLNLRTNRQRAMLNKGEKTVQLQVVFEDGAVHAYTFNTTQDTLGAVLRDARLIEGEESEYGMFIQSVDGVTADTSKQQWWCLMKDGESLQSGVDSTLIADGDAYLLVLRTGW